MASAAASSSAGAGAAAAAPAKRTPSEFLKSLIGRPVIVRLSSGSEYKGAPDCFLCGRASRQRKAASARLPTLYFRSTGPYDAGILVCLDGFMNVALEQTEEWSGGMLRGKHGDCFLRGNNGE